MNFNSKTDNGEDDVFAMTAMVDVVFILLAFFVMATRIELPEQEFSLKYEQVNLAQGLTAEDLPEMIPVQLRKSDGGVKITVGQAELPRDDYDALRAKLVEINLPQITVMISAEPNLAVDEVAKAMEAVLQSPMRKLSMSELLTE